MNQGVELIFGYSHLPSTKVDHNSLPFLHAYSWEVYAIGPSLEIRVSLSQALLIPEELNDFPVKIDQAADHITHRPSFSIDQAVFVPLLNSRAIEGVRTGIVAYSSLRIEHGLEGAPSDLHMAIRLEMNLVIVPS